MAAKVRVKEAGVILMAVMDVEEPLEVVDGELLHAAARRPRQQTPDVTANFLVICLKETTLVHGKLATVRTRSSVGWPGSDHSGSALPTTLGSAA
jgi:hypothetical protein